MNGGRNKPHRPRLVHGRLHCSDCRRPPVRVSLLDGVDEARTVRGIKETVILERPPPAGEDR